MLPLEKKSGEPVTNTEAEAASPTKNDQYEIWFASNTVQRFLQKAYDKMSASEATLVKDTLSDLKKDPRGSDKRRQFIKLAANDVAEYRAKAGRFRIMYDIDEPRKRVVVLAIRRRNEGTYK